MTQESVVFDSQLTQDQWLFLSGLPDFGFATLQKLSAQMPQGISRVFQMSVDELTMTGLPPQLIQKILRQDDIRVKQAHDWLRQGPQRFVITLNDPAYPPLLKHTARPPMVLFGWGNPLSLTTPQMAVIGSRKPTHSGRQLAQDFAASLCASGWTVTSGLALGIDGMAHNGALAVEGQTIAVLGGGLDVIYPAKHQGLARAIVDTGGCLVSEFWPDEPPVGSNFPRRNRIISGMSYGCLVIEAAIKSGSLITARYALEQGREVFALPGSIFNPLTKGCHYLIREGAKLVEEVADINEEFQNLSFWQQGVDKKNTEKSSGQPLATDKLLDSVGFETTSIDVITQRSGLSVTTVLAKLLEYELRGLVATAPGGYVKLGGKSNV